MPRLSAIGFTPPVTLRNPSRTIACARTVAVVVPSPATSDVLVATSFTICAPMFSSGSDSSISFATVTPSLVMVGAPNFLSMTTFRPLGPRVTFTASASLSTPRLRAARASVLNCRSLADMVDPCGKALGEDREDVALAQDEQRLAVDHDFAAAVLPEQDLVAGFDFHRHALAVVEAARSGRDDLALLRLFLGGVGDEEPAARLLVVLERSHDDAIG